MSLLLLLRSPNTTSTITISNNTGATYSGTSDTQISSLRPTINYGTNAIFESTNWDATDVTHALIKFTGLSNVAAGTVSNVSLKLYVTNINGLPVTLVYALSRNFVDIEANWTLASTGVNWGTAGANNTANDYNSTLLKSLGVTASGAYVTFSSAALTAYVQAIVNGGADFGLVLRDNSEPGNNLNIAAVYASSNATDGTRPILSFDYQASAGALKFPSFLLMMLD